MGNNPSFLNLHRSSKLFQEGWALFLQEAPKCFSWKRPEQEVWLLTNPLTLFCFLSVFIFSYWGGVASPPDKNMLDGSQPSFLNLGSSYRWTSLSLLKKIRILRTCFSSSIYLRETWTLKTPISKDKMLKVWLWYFTAQMAAALESAGRMQKLLQQAVFAGLRLCTVRETVRQKATAPRFHCTTLQNINTSV